jgi:hypothetical protein
MLLVYPAENDSVIRYEAGEHDHSIAKKFRGIRPELKIIIDQMIEDGTNKPKGIMNALRNRQIPDLPTNRQIETYLSDCRRKKGMHSISLGDLIVYADGNKAIPTDDDSVYVCGFECEYSETMSSHFRICLSTKRLLLLISGSENVHTDATYKLNWQGYPVLTIGFSDKNRTFHPIGIAVTFQETAEDFSFIFKSIAAGVDTVSDGSRKFSPTCLISDAAPAIRNGFIVGLGYAPEKTVMCWAHVVMNVDKKRPLVKDAAVWDEIKRDIHHLQLCLDEEEFRTAVELFLKKWESDDTADVGGFLEYFKES